MPASSYPRLLGDIGGTKARFALQEAPGAAPQRVRRFATDDCPTLVDAVRRYLGEAGVPRVAQAADHAFFLVIPRAQRDVPALAVQRHPGTSIGHHDEP